MHGGRLSKFILDHLNKHRTTPLHFLPRAEAYLSDDSRVTRDPQFGMLTDYTDGNVIQCSCRQIFAQLSTYTNHQRTCKKRKKRLLGALAKAKLAWDNRKKRHTGDNTDEHSGDSGTSGISNLLNTDHVDGQGRPQELELQFPHNEFNRRSVSAHVQFDGLF